MTARKKPHHLIDKLHDEDAAHHEQVSRIGAKQDQLKQRIEALKQQRPPRGETEATSGLTVAVKW